MSLHLRLLRLLFVAAVGLPTVASAIDGAFDSTWQGTGYIAFSGDSSNPGHLAYVTQLVVQPNGKLLVGGASSNGSSSYPWLGELTSAGAFVPTFGKSDGSGRVTLCQLDSSYCNGTLDTLDALQVANNGDLFTLARGRVAFTTPTANAIDTASTIQLVAINNVGGALATAIAARVQSNGSVIAAGPGYYSTSSSSSREFGVARFTSALSLDTSFNAFTDTAGVTFAGGNLASFADGSGDIPESVLLRPDNRIVVVGETADGRLGMACFTAAGLTDTACSGGLGYGAAGWSGGKFNPSSTGLLFTQPATAIDRAGRILVALTGAPSGAAGISDYGIVVGRFNADLSPDTSFGSNAFSFTNHFPACPTGVGASSIALDSAGRILVAGYCRSDNVFEFGVERLRGDNGALDASFGVGGFSHGSFSATSTGDSAYAVAFDSSGRPLVGGITGGAASAGLARLTYDLIFTDNLEITPRGCSAPNCD